MEVRAAFLGLILLVSSVPSAVLADVPRSFEVEELNRRISHGRLVQVHTHAGRFQTEDATARPDGINYRGIVTSTIRDTLPFLDSSRGTRSSRSTCAAAPAESARRTER